MYWMNTYRTIDVARIFGIHVNTVRLYKKYGLIPKPERRSNGYRIFTDMHIEQFRLARVALQVEVLQNGLRKLAVDIIKVCASGDYERAAELTRGYIAQVEIEKEKAEEAIEITEDVLSGIAGADSASKSDIFKEIPRESCPHQDGRYYDFLWMEIAPSIKSFISCFSFSFWI